MTTNYNRILDEALAADRTHTNGRRPKDPAPTLDAKPGLVVRRGTGITPRAIDWLWRRRLPRGRYVELVGYPGIGKTALVMDVIARITTDGRWPDGTTGKPCDVIIVAAEDEAEDVLVPRLLAAGANLEGVHFVDGIVRAGADELADLDLSKVLDFAALRDLFATTKAGFGFIDALDDVLGAKYDGKGQSETRRALGPIRRLAKQTGAVILGLRHPSKRIALGPALNQGNGSIAYGGVARGSMLVTVDPDDADRRLLLATKSNISRLAETLGFRLECQADEDIPPKVIWDRLPDPRTADDVLADLRTQEQANPNDAEAEATKLEQAEEVVRVLLTGRDGQPVWIPVSELERLARQRDVTTMTLRRAKASLDLQYHRDGFGKGSRMLCSLPGTDPYTLTSRDVSVYGVGDSEPAAEPVASQAATEPPHTRPSHTRSSPQTEAWASMQGAPSDDPAWADRGPPGWLEAEEEDAP